jgi:hypothetical protein
MTGVRCLPGLRIRRAASLCFLLVIDAVYGAGAFAQQPHSAPAPIRISDRLARLEDDFWQCDYTATAHGVAATRIEVCIAAYASLKEEKFSGSFDELLTWWADNKERRHRDIERGTQPVR